MQNIKPKSAIQFLRYVYDEVAAYNRQQGIIYYNADCLMAIVNNTSRYAGGSTINSRLYDLLNPKALDDRTGIEIAMEVLSRAGIEVIE